MEKINLKVVLPAGEVTVPVDQQSTPGHLKENIKYSLGVPPKCIKLTCDGRELDDLKTVTGEPNNLVEGSTVVATAEGSPDADLPKKEIAKPAQPTMIRKEEPPKPKKPKKLDVVRPTVKEGDVVKKEVIKEGTEAWTPQYVEGKSSKRHMAYFRVESLDPSEPKSYPEQEDGHFVLMLGDPQTAPAWTAAASQMKVGEKAKFTMKKDVVDFDPDNLCPDFVSSDWAVELLKVEEVEDINGDFSAILHVEEEGGADKANDLDRVFVHWRIRRWHPEGLFCIGSSRERIALLPGYGLVPIEDMHAPPVRVSVGEGQQEAVELVAARLGAGGKGHVFLKSEAMAQNRPGGTVIIDVELVGLDPCRGPGSEGWKGFESLLMEREQGDRWLEEADDRRKQLETFGTLKKSTGDTKEAEQHVAAQVHKFANNAARRYRRAFQWAEQDKALSEKAALEKCHIGMGLARAQALSHQRFGEAAEAKATKEELEALSSSSTLLKDVLKHIEELKVDEVKREHLMFDCLQVTLQVCIQAEDVAEGRRMLEQLEALRPHDEELRNDRARLNRLQSALELKQGAGTVETLQLELRGAVEAQDKPKVAEALSALYDLMKNNQVKYDVVLKIKVGKDVGNAMKMGDPDLAAQGRKIVQEIQRLAQQGALGY